MIRILRARDRHFEDFGWLKTHWLFSFDHYYDPENAAWGTLRVFNDDVVAPGEGFPMHPHREMEIVTVVHSGEIRHRDSLGNEAVIRAGEVQRMSAGTGLVHSEHNPGKGPLHLYQIWILPAKPGVTPSYEQRDFSQAPWENGLLALASGRNHSGALKLNADAAIYRGSLEPGESLVHEADPTRRIFIYLSEGELACESETLRLKDQARIVPEGSVRLAAKGKAGFVLIDTPEGRG